MAKRTERTEVAKIEAPDPSFLMQYEEQDSSLAGMDEYVILPFLRIVQDQTKNSAHKDNPGVGGVVLSPGDVVIHEPGGDGFLFVPLFFHTEFLKTADIKDTESGFIVDRTFDPTSPIAKKARNPDLRSEIYEGYENKPVSQQRFHRYIETLNFSGVVYGEHPASGQEGAIVFSKAEFTTGRRFISGIKMRREVVGEEGDERAIKVPLWSQVWHFSTSQRPPRNGGQWYGFDFTPAEFPLIDPTDAEEFRAKHEALKEAHSDNKLRIDTEDARGDDTEIEDGDNAFA